MKIIATSGFTPAHDTVEDVILGFLFAVAVVAALAIAQEIWNKRHDRNRDDDSRNGRR